MSPNHTLRDVFVANAPKRCRPGVLALADLDSFLERSVASAHSAFPDVELVSDVFIAGWASRLPDSEHVSEALLKTRVSELYLAMACAEGDRPAIAILEERYFKSVDHALSRLRLAPALWDDVKQEMRRTLFVRKGGSLPKIAGYSGRGSLNAWIRTIAVRFGRRLIHSEPREKTSARDDLMPTSLVGRDPQLSYIRKLYLHEFKAAFAKAMAAFSVQERNLIRFYYLDGLGVEKIAGILQLHHSSISRRLARTRDQLLAGTRQHLRQRLRVADCEVDSIMRALGSRLSVGGKLSGLAV